MKIFAHVAYAHSNPLSRMTQARMTERTLAQPAPPTSTAAVQPLRVDIVADARRREQKAATKRAVAVMTKTLAESGRKPVDSHLSLRVDIVAEMRARCAGPSAGVR